MPDLSTDFFGLPSVSPASGPVPDFRGHAPAPIRDKHDFFEAMHGPPVEESEDLERILALPRRPQIDLSDDSPKAQALVEIMNDRLRRPDWRRPEGCACRALAPERGDQACMLTLRASQAWSLYEAPILGGLLGTLATGSGKTLIGILMPIALVLAGYSMKRAVGLVPSNLVKQLQREHRLAAEHWLVPDLIINPSDRPNGNLKGDRPKLYIIPYSKLSSTESSLLLKNLAPDLIYADEMHKLAHLDTARTSRFARLFVEMPDTRFCGWSGTPWDKSVQEAAHLAAYALRRGSPLPLDPSQVRVWAAALDPSAFSGREKMSPGAMQKLCVAGETLERGFQRRLLETPGVVATREGAVDTPLNLYTRDPGKIPPVLKEMIDNAGDKRPDGEELLDAMEQARVKRELICGFYYRWRFPRMPREADGKTLTKESIAQIELWFARRKAWRCELRYKLESREEHLDSEKLCTNAAARYHQDPPYEGDLPTWDAETYKGWIEVKDTVYHETVPVWVDDYLVDDAIAWGKEHRGVIWTEHTAYAHRVAEKGGFPYHGGGPNAEANILAERGDRTIVASIDSHGTGRDGLQYLFHEQLITSMPSSGKGVEQLLAREHRVGQLKPVNTWLYRHTQELRDAIKTAASRSAFVNGTWGASQKLLTANRDFDLGIEGE